VKYFRQAYNARGYQVNKGPEMRKPRSGHKPYAVCRKNAGVFIITQWSSLFPGRSTWSGKAADVPRRVTTDNGTFLPDG